MGPVITVDDAVKSALEQDSGIDALPGGNEELWERSPLGTPKKWPNTLRAFAAFITTLPYPAAVLWGDNLVLLHNVAWKDAADGSAKQGMPQKEILAEESLGTIRMAMMGKTCQSLQAELFLNSEAQDGVKYQALLSPLMDGDEDLASGVIIQLFQMTQGQERRKSEQQGILRQVQEALSGKGGEQIKGQNNPLDSLPLDENPFFQRFAAMLPTGMAILNYKAEAVFVNEQFFKLTTSGGQNFKAWPQSIHSEDYERVMEAYRESFKRPGKTLRVEFRTIGPQDVWRLLMLSPLGDSRMRDESIEKYGGFVCAVIDITPNKAQELAQKQAAQEAVERKEQQERFIDMISHEIRNPLSAVLHCAEEILEMVEPRKPDKSDFSDSRKSAITESAETIKLCVAHQKNIVDDILSFSKLDASMLSLCPRNVQPRRQLADSLKMFQPEIKKQNMELDYKIDTSYEEANVDWVKADLVRISQILVNLVTNAIKFTARKDGERKITAIIGASEERPTSYPPNVVFFDTEDLGFRMDGTNTSEWGNGQALYIMVAVKDTGIGISTENQKKLFQRFRQATPKTEESYGGSGLGLMISRKLCKLHGGEIGVSSIEGVGSTFGFFFKVRKVEDADQNPPQRDRLGSNDLMEHMHVAPFSIEILISITNPRVRHQITKGQAPIASISDEDAQSNLKNPTVGRTNETCSGAHGDEKWQHTAEIASHVGEVKGDEYGQKSRPPHPAILRTSSSTGKVPTTLERMQKRTDLDMRKKNNVGEDASAEIEHDKTHILLVEDNVINQRILKRQLEAKNFKVTAANNGREAVNVVKENSHTAGGLEKDKSSLFDVILMDQEMPVLDGNAATKEIRKLGEAGEVLYIPILGVTANVREEQKVDMISSGMDDVISKPYSMEDLIGKIRGLVEQEQESDAPCKEPGAGVLG